MAKKIIAVPRSPLADREAIKRDDYQQQAQFPLGKLIIRGDGNDAAFLDAVKKTLRVKPPTTPNTTAAVGKTATLLWLGPTEWLLWTTQPAKHATALTAALADLHAAVIDVSDYYIVIRLSGAKTAQVLAHGCPLDLRDTRFPVGHCAQSHYRNAGILLHRGDAHYDIQVRASYAHYLWDYFATISEDNN